MRTYSVPIQLASLFSPTDSSGIPEILQNFLDSVLDTVDAWTLCRTDNNRPEKQPLHFALFITSVIDQLSELLHPSPSTQRTNYACLFVLSVNGQRCRIRLVPLPVFISAAGMGNPDLILVCWLCAPIGVSFLGVAICLYRFGCRYVGINCAEICRPGAPHGCVSFLRHRYRLSSSI